MTGRSRCAALAALLLALLPGCQAGRRGVADGRPVAVATIAPLADLVRSVAGPGWTVRTVIPPGTSPHVFEPEPSDLRKLVGAKLVVVAGAGYDAWMGRILAACASNARLHDTAASLGIGPGAHDDEAAGLHEGHDHGPEEPPGGEPDAAESGHEGHAHGVLGEDPHWWLSPVLAARSLAPLAEELAAVDPAGAEGYRRRARETADAYLALDRELAAKLAPVRGKRFVSAHRAWVYFADRYGLVEAASIEPVPGREPSPRQLKALVEEGRRGGLGRLFTEPQFPPAAARVVAREARLELALVDPIGGVPGRETYPQLMRFNADAFRRALPATTGAKE
ncbi:MAG: zinc ABC transporter substrate-binding protein [Holophagales bacterium]|nr:zinc ABC transporter substrate-binding protein [Holophagales bacterium]MBK9967030.1 zinc ABC transporter substrate-binding protein [Holophagales bacterium]